MKIFPYFLMLGLFLGPGVAVAKCLNRPDEVPECRYPQGDSWCAEHETRNPYAYSDACLKQRQAESLPDLKKYEAYESVRQKMLQAGWKPYQAPGADSCYEEDSRCANRPEMSSCSGTGMGYCQFLWIKNNEITGICTIGEEALFEGVCKYDIGTTQTVQNVAEDTTTSAQLLKPYQGWWHFPDNTYGCDDEDNQYRVALGTYEYSQELSRIVFGQGATAIGFYDFSCYLPNGKRQDQVLRFSSKCTMEEGQTESGTLSITVRDKNNIAIRFPFSPDDEMLLIRCPSN